MLHVWPSGLGCSRHVEAVPLGDELRLTLGETAEITVALEVVPHIGDAELLLHSANSRCHGNVEKSKAHCHLR